MIRPEDFANVDRPRRRLRAGALDVPTAVALLSAYAGLAHLAVAPEHFEEWWGYGTFFVVIGVLQLACVLLALRPTPRARSAALVMNVLVLLVYVQSRTIGVLIGPGAHGHGIERPAPYDLGVAAAEVAVVALLAMSLGDRARRFVTDGLLAVGVALLLALAPLWR